MRGTKGYTYFAIKTENSKIELLDFNNLLTIRPTSFDKMFERGVVPKSTSWKYTSEELVKPNFYEEIEKLIEVLEPHLGEFKLLKSKYPEFNFVLEVVIYMGNESPGLHFSRRTIEFINQLEAVIDCDIYPE